MFISRPQRHHRWVFTALLVLFLGAQALQTAHVHADHGFTPDCVQCFTDGGESVLTERASGPVCAVAGPANHPTLALETVSNYYRRAARGPPELSR